MVQVAYFDEHAAVRAGLSVMLGARPNLSAVGAASNEPALMAMLAQARPDVVVLDLCQAGGRGLPRLLRLRQQLPGLHIVDYSADRVEDLVVAAFFAGADAVVSKSDTPGALFDAIENAADGRRTPSAISPRLLNLAASRLDPADYAILTMRLAGEDMATIAQTLGLSGSVVANRGARVLAQLGQR